MFTWKKISYFPHKEEHFKLNFKQPKAIQEIYWQKTKEAHFCSCFYDKKSITVYGTACLVT